MKKNRFKPVLLVILVLITTSLACSSLAPAIPTATVMPTETSVPSTNTPVPTFTPRPTATLVPTPAPIGSSVTYNSLEITVLDVVNRESMHFGNVLDGWETFYKPIAGHYLIDVGVLVRNLKPNSFTSVTWGHIYIVEENGDSWYPGWGKAKTVEIGTKFDPLTMGLSSRNLSADDLVDFKNDTYLRLIFSVVADPKLTVLFGIEDSPMIGFHVSK